MWIRLLQKWFHLIATFQRFDQQPQNDDAEKFYKLKWSRVQLELASDTVKQMAEFLDKSIEKLGKQKEKGEKKLEKEKKKVEKAENQNSILQERITGKGVHHFGSILPPFWKQSRLAWTWNWCF